MKAIFKTHDEFIADGFKRDYPYYYKGTKKNSDARVKAHLVDNLGGKEVTVVDIDSYAVGLVEVTTPCGGHSVSVSTWMLRGKCLLNKIKYPASISIGGKRAKYFETFFKFPCSFDELKKRDAVRVAKWILKVSTDAPLR